MNKQYFQSLIEGVKKRTSSGSIPIYHKDSPIGKYVSKELHDQAISKIDPQQGKISNPLEHAKLYDIIQKGANRGRIGNAKNISYSFKPDVSIKNNKIVHTTKTEHGFHRYRFDTKSNRQVYVSIKHGATKQKGAKNKSHIMFDVDGMMSMDNPEHKESTSTAVQVIRGVNAAVNHHIKALNPDIITFHAQDDFGEWGDHRDKAKLYRFMVKKLRKKYHAVITQKNVNTSEGLHRITTFKLINRKLKIARELKNNK